MMKTGDILGRVRSMVAKDTERDAEMDIVRSIKLGDYEAVVPGLLADDYDLSPTANFIDSASKDMAKVIAPLPQITAPEQDMSHAKSRKFADKKQKIVRGYVTRSNLQTQMFPACERLLTYGFVPFMVKADYSERAPLIQAVDSYGFHYTLNWRGDAVIQAAQESTDTLGKLCADFPECATALRGAHFGAGEEHEIKLYQWHDMSEMVLLTDGGVELDRYPQPLGRCPFQVAELPQFDKFVRGQFANVTGVQIANVKAAQYMLSAMQEAAEAPIAVPNDMTDLALGPLSILRSENPQAIHRVDLGIPPSLFAERQTLLEDLRTGSNYPEGRSGSIDASVVTGQGVNALMGTFSSHTQSCQLILAQVLRNIFSMCLEMDERLWPNKEKTVRGDDAGSPYEITYTPSKDIKGDYTCHVTYGLSLGLDPNRAAVLLLQLLTAGVISHDTMMREMPISMDVEREKALIADENLQSAILQAVMGLSQSLPMMIQQGQDPSEIMAKIAEIGKATLAGVSPVEAVAKAFPPPPPQPAVAGPQGGLGGPQGPGGLPGTDPNTGVPQGIAQGQAQYGSGGAQDLLMQLAGTSASGQPNLATTLSRRVPV